MPIFKVKLNGTSVNPYHLYGLTQNPFPQIGKAEYNALCWLLNNLAAEPIKDIVHLRERLKGASEEFVEMCVKQFKPGEIAKFEISFPGD